MVDHLIAGPVKSYCLTIVVLMVARRVECVKYPGWLRDSIYIYMPGNVVMRGVGFPAQPIFEVL